MRPNLGQVDRIIRTIVGIVLIALPFVLGGGSASLLLWGLAVVGLVLVITAFVSFCPLYRLIGVSTSKVK